MAGSIQKRSDRSDRPWRARYRHAGRRYSRSFTTKAAAERWLRDQLTQVDHGDWVAPNAGQVTFGQVADQWQSIRQASTRESTSARDESYLSSLILPVLGDRPIASLKPSDLQRWVDEMSAAGKSPATVRKAWQITGSILRLAVRDRMISTTPARDVSLPQDHRDEPLFLTDEQILTLAEAMASGVYRQNPDRWPDTSSPMVLLGGFAGLRLGEVLGLQVADLDLLQRRLTVRRTASDVRGEVVVGPPKTRKARRTVALPHLVVEAMAGHLEANSPPDRFVFSTAEGGPLRRTNWVRRVWKPTVEAVGFDPALRFHDLRHSHVALLIAQGEHPKTIADRMGHTSVRTVLDVYGHLLPTADQDAVDRLDQRLSRAGGTPVGPSRDPADVIALPR